MVSGYWLLLLSHLKSPPASHCSFSTRASSIPSWHCLPPTEYHYRGKVPMCQRVSGLWPSEDGWGNVFVFMLRSTRGALLSWWLPKISGKKLIQLYFLSLSLSIYLYISSNHGLGTEINFSDNHHAILKITTSLLRTKAFFFVTFIFLCSPSLRKLS